jgi:hypothetical protein
MLKGGDSLYNYLTMFLKNEWDVGLAEESINTSQFDPFDPAREPKHAPIYQPGAR